MDYSSKESGRAFANGFFYALNLVKAAGQNVDLGKLESTLKEIDDGDTTIAHTPTDHLLAMEKMMEKATGKKLTDQQKAVYLRMVSPVAKQDDDNKEAAKLVLRLMQGDYSLFD